MSIERGRMFRQFFTIAVVLCLTAGAAVAQTTTATIRGAVNDESGNPFPTAEIVATNAATGFTYRAVAANDGGFTLSGLTPGSYRITVTAPSYKGTSREVTVLVGQTLDMNFRLQPDLVVMEEITVVGSTPIEMQATEIATNVTRQQIENLPQGNRNFMNFAALAPGLRVSDDEFRKTFAAGAQPASAVNVFIDGVSFKNDVLQGGVVGQDSSRGNPFPQNAVQEFRVLTQNYSAEFQKSSSAVITAVTKSGTNDFMGDIFGFFQDKALVDTRNPLLANPGDKPEYQRLQLGASVGGPIIRDKMHFFASYESNDEERENTVSFGGTTGAAADAVRARFASAPGLYESPFELKLLFGKMSFQPASAHLFDLSAYKRDESDVRGFSGATSFESAEDVVQDIWQGALRYQLSSSSWLNEATVSFQEYTWNPRPVNSQTIGMDFQGVIRVGGRDSEQNFTQERLSLRDDITFTGLFGGNHSLKIGGNVDLLDYTVFKDFAGNPVFRFRAAENYDFPFEASYGLGNPDLSGDNTQYGLYVQDDWRVTDRATINMGVRWDYESDMFPTDYVTPQRVRDAVGFLNVPSNYFTDGNDRSAIDNMFAPRFGATYDLFGNNRSIVFGGFGRYYDRILYNNSLDERFRLQFSVGLFRFSRDGQPRDGQPTVAWDPRYLSESGLQEVLATGVTGNPEIFLIENDTRAPYSDQWNIGLRQSLGSFVAELSYGNVRGKNGFTFIRGNRRPDGTCCIAIPGFAGLIVSSDDVRTWYDAIYFKLDRPFTANSNWSFGLAYTHNDATQIGGDLFSLDFPRVDDYPRYPTQSVPDHEATLNFLYRLPWDVTLGSLLRYNSGLKYNIDDQSAGGGVNQRRFLRGEGEEDADTLLDFRVEKTFRIGGVGLGIIGEVFNIFDDELFNNYDGFIPTLPNTNANFGKPRGVAFGSGRRFQYGARITF